MNPMHMRHQYNMDKILRQKLEHAEAPVPETMWSQITTARQERKGFVSGWAGFAGALILVSLIAAYLTLNEGAGLTTPDTPSAPDGQAISSAYQATDARSTTSETMDYAPDANAAMEEMLPAAGTPAPSATGKTDVSPASASDASASRKTSGKDASPTKSVDKERTASEAQRSSEESTAKPTAPAPGSSASATASPTPETQRVITAGVRQPDAKLAPLMALLPSVQETSYERASLPLLQILQQNRKRSPSCYAFNSYLRGLSFDLFGAPEYASRQLVYKEAGMADYASLRKDMESFSFAYSMGLRASAHFQGGFAMRTGIVYTDILERFTYNDPDAEITRIIQVNVDTFILGGDVHIVVDTLSIVEYGHREKVAYNSYRFYDVPLIIGYEFDRGRWFISLNTGIMLNIATARRGNMLDPDMRLVSINSNESDAYGAFRSRVGSSLIMSLGLNYALTSKLHLLMEPQFRMWMQPLTLRDYPIDQKYVNMGLALGIRQYL
jgi:hypothetical protein